jgi:hypothetical protein
MKTLKWTGTAAGVAGATLVALNLPFSGWGFVLFLVSSISWMVAGALHKDNPLVALNFVFTLTNLLGIWRWLLV